MFVRDQMMPGFIRMIVPRACGQFMPHDSPEVKAYVGPSPNNHVTEQALKWQSGIFGTADLI
jgi:hypothetical protein